MMVLDGLASWNDGSAKSSILDFVQRVTTEGGKDQSVPSFFVLDRIRALAPQPATMLRPSLIGPPVIVAPSQCASPLLCPR